MTDKKLELTEEELQEKIEAAVEAATAGLVKKRDELLSENKKLKKGGTDTAETEKLEAELEALKSQLKESQKENTKLKKSVDDTTKALQAEQQFTQSTLIDSGLTAELVNAGVKNPAHLKATQALLRGNVQIVTEGDKRVAKVGEKLLSDFVKEWASSDEGKHFVTAPSNKGGGAQGGRGDESNQPKGDMSGSKDQRVAAIQARLAASAEA